MKRSRTPQQHLPGKITAADRVKLYPKILYASDGLLFCKICSKAVDHMRLNTIKDHLNSKTHARNETLAKQGEVETNRGIKRQSTLTESLHAAKKACDQRSEVITDFIKAFAAANIPLEKASNPVFREFLQKHVCGGGAIAMASTLRHHIDAMDMHGQHKLRVKEIISQAQTISIIVDETQDAKGQFVMNILAVPGLTTIFSEHLIKSTEIDGVQNEESEDEADASEGSPKKKRANSYLKPLLLDTVFLTAVNSATVAQAIIKVLSFFDINFESVIAFLSDNASYMLKCFNEILSAVCSNCIHITCWAHILNLVGETFRDIFARVDDFVAKMKKCFKNSARRKRFYVSFLKEQGVANARAPPHPVITRWSSWFEAVAQHKQYFKHYRPMMEALKKDSSDTPAPVQAVLDILSSIPHLELELTFITVKSKRIMKFIKDVQSQDIQVHTIYDTMNDLWTWAKESAQTSYHTLVEAEGCTKKAAKDVGATMVSCMTACEEKLCSYMEGKQPGIPFLKAVRAFDPKQAFLFRSKFPDIVKAIPYLSSMGSSNLDEEFKVYQQAAAEFIMEGCRPAPSQGNGGENYCVTSTDLILFWKSQEKRTPHLYKVAMAVLSVPINSADAERSFSTYNMVLTDKRHNLTQEHLRFFTSLYFNGRYGIL